MKEIVDFIGLGIAGLLALLWWDIRNIRKTFITTEDYEKLKEIQELERENSLLKQEKGLREYMDEKISDLKDFMRNGNSDS